MPLSDDTRPDSDPDTLPEGAPELQSQEGPPEGPPAQRKPPTEQAPSAQQVRTAHHELLDQEHPTLVEVLVPLSSLEPIPHTTGGTQISTLGSGDTRPSDAMPRSHTERLPSGFDPLDERLHAVEHRLDRLDARMRLVEKGAASSGASHRAGLLWWGVVLGALLLGALYSRLR